MRKDEARKEYEKLFSDDRSKAAAFDKIAELFYLSNFGTAGKSDIDTLMFSIYLDRLMEINFDDYESYSDYSMSKQLGITQTRISNLKVKKELMYPSEKYDWKQLLAKATDNVVYENEKIRLYIPDRNVYLEVKNVIEKNGGYVETQLNGNLLQVRAAYFLDLILYITDTSDRETVRKSIAETIKRNADISVSEKESFGKALQKQTPGMIIDILGELLSSVPFAGGAIKVILKNVHKAMDESNKQRDE